MSFILKYYTLLSVICISVICCEKHTKTKTSFIQAAKCSFEAFVAGPCRARKPMWSFNPKNGKCGKYYYGGCHLFENGVDISQNRFFSQSSCNQGDHQHINHFQDIITHNFEIMFSLYRNLKQFLTTPIWKRLQQEYNELLWYFRFNKKLSVTKNL
jgi:hypothetical protein